MALRDDVTRLLNDLNAGKEQASDELFTLVYDELRSLAKSYMLQEQKGHTLQTTALVNEAYLRLGGEKEINWESRAHFFRVAARAMRRVLIDHARAKGRDKRKGKRSRIHLEHLPELTNECQGELLEIDIALERLSKIDPRISQMIELRFFGGLSVDQTAKVMGVSPRTISEEWRFAKAWFKKELGNP